MINNKLNVAFKYHTELALHLFPFGLTTFDSNIMPHIVFFHLLTPSFGGGLDCFAVDGGGNAETGETAAQNFRGFALTVQDV